MENLRRSKLSYPPVTSSIVFADSKTEISNEEILVLIATRGDELKKLGLKQSHRVLFETSFSIDFFVLLLSLGDIGAVAFLVDSEQTPQERKALEDEIQPQWKVMKDGSIQACGSPPIPRIDVMPHDAAFVLFTSGTSGRPKAVVHGFTNLRARLDAGYRAIPSEDRGRALCLLPFHFGHGLIGVALATLFGGECLVLPPDLSLSSFSKAAAWIDQYSVHFVSGTPTTWSLVLRTSRPPSRNTLRRIQIASAHAGHELFEAARAWSGSRIWNVYGLTECASWISDFEYLKPGDEACIGDGLNWETRFDIRVPGETETSMVGEIEISTRSLFLGYLFDGAKLERLEPFRTQDLGSKDGFGRVSISGRLNRLINRGGAKVSPEEIEIELRKKSNVRDAVVIGLPESSGLTGIGALVTFEKPATDVDQLRETESWLRLRLSSYKIPTQWKVCDAIPRRPNGKPDLVEIGLLWKRT